LSKDLGEFYPIKSTVLWGFGNYVPGCLKAEHN